MELLVPGYENPKKVVFDTNIWINLTNNTAQLEWMKENICQNKIKVFDTPVNQFEIIYYSPNKGDVKNKNLRKRIKELKIIDEITNDNILPSPTTVIIRRMCDFLKIQKDNNTNELKDLINSRKQFIDCPDRLKDENTKEVFKVELKRREGFKKMIEDIQKKFQFTRQNFNCLINSKEFKSDMFECLMEKLKISRVDLKYDLRIWKGWENIDVLKAVSNSIIKILEKTCASGVPGRRARDSDISDIDFAVYIPIVDIFVTENKTDFQGILANEIEQNKILTFNEFREKLEK